ncbi:MAG: hypothetical protein GX258_09675 [Clostridiales bacterium]|nr:hypothetical protein [Clostridiales bacterium]
MLSIIKEYMGIYKSSSYSLTSLKNIIIAAGLGVIFYIRGTEGNINQMNTVIITTFSILVIMFSCTSINNELFVYVNKDKFKDVLFYKKIIASNISCLLQLILYIFVFIIINIYFLKYNQLLDLVLQIVNLIILSTSVGNLLLITNKNQILINITTSTDINKRVAIIQIIKQGGVSIALGIILHFLYYNLNYNSLILLILSLVTYILSLIINERLGFDIKR